MQRFLYNTSWKGYVVETVWWKAGRCGFVEFIKKAMIHAPPVHKIYDLVSYIVKGPYFFFLLCKRHRTGTRAIDISVQFFTSNVMQVFVSQST